MGTETVIPNSADAAEGEGNPRRGGEIGGGSDVKPYEGMWQVSQVRGVYMAHDMGDRGQKSRV